METKPTTLVKRIFLTLYTPLRNSGMSGRTPARAAPGIYTLRENQVGAVQKRPEILISWNVCYQRLSNRKVHLLHEMYW